MKIHPAIFFSVVVLLLAHYPLQAQVPRPRHGFLVVAHRGDHTQAPENTLAAYQHAIEEGVDYVEIDLRTSQDGQLVIMHDATVDRMTNGRGMIRDLRFDSLRTLRIKDKFHPEWGEYQIPSFREVLRLCKNKIYIYLDFKNADPAKAYQEIGEFAMEKQVVVYINAAMQVTKWREAAPDMPLMVSLPDNVKDTAALRIFLTKNRLEILDGD